MQSYTEVFQLNEDPGLALSEAQRLLQEELDRACAVPEGLLGRQRCSSAAEALSRFNVLPGRDLTSPR